MNSAADSCGQASRPSDGDETSDVSVLWSACQRFHPARQSLVAAASKTRQRFEAVEALYAQRKQDDKGLIAEADRLAN